MNDGRWVTISGRRVFIRTNEHPMNAYFKNEFSTKTPLIKAKDLKKYLEGGGIVYKGLQGNAYIYDKNDNSLVPTIKYKIRRDIWSDYLINSKVERISNKKNKYGDYEYKLKNKEE